MFTTMKLIGKKLQKELSKAISYTEADSQKDLNEVEKQAKQLIIDADSNEILNKGMIDL